MWYNRGLARMQKCPSLKLWALWWIVLRVVARSKGLGPVQPLLGQSAPQVS